MLSHYFSNWKMKTTSTSTFRSSRCLPREGISWFDEDFCRELNSCFSRAISIKNRWISCLTRSWNEMRMKPQQTVVWHAILSIFCCIYQIRKTCRRYRLNCVFTPSIWTQHRSTIMTFSVIGQVITVLYATGPGHHQMEWFLSIMSAVFVVRPLFVDAYICIIGPFLVLSSSLSNTPKEAIEQWQSYTIKLSFGNYKLLLK